MTNTVNFIDIETDNGLITYAIIDRGNGEFTSMLKSTYDAQLAAQETVPSNSSIKEAPAKK